MIREGAPTLRERVRKPMALAMAISALAVDSTRASNAESASSREAIDTASIGFFSNYLFSKDAAVAEAEAEAIKDAGGKIGRIVVPYVRGSAEVNNMRAEICNAAEATHNRDLELQIVFQGFYKSGRMGYLPSTAAEKSRFKTMITNLMWQIAGDRNPDGSGGCVPELEELTLSLNNEPTNKPMNYNQEVDGKRVAIGRTASLYKTLYGPLHTEAARPGLELDLTIVGGEIATTSRHRPLETIEELAGHLEGEKAMDAFAFHYYANGEDATSETPGQNRNSASIQEIVSKIREEFGKDIPIKLTELGGISDTPVSKEDEYEEKLGPAVPTLPGEKQARFYANTISQAACNGIEEISIFHMTDDPADPLRSGWRYPQGGYKPGIKNIVIDNLAELTNRDNC